MSQSATRASDLAGNGMIEGRGSRWQSSHNSEGELSPERRCMIGVSAHGRTTKVDEGWACSARGNVDGNLNLGASWRVVVPVLVPGALEDGDTTYSGLSYPHRRI